MGGVLGGMLSSTPVSIPKAAIPQRVESRLVEVAAFALIVWSKRTAAVGAFLPLKTKPTQVLKHRRNELHFGADGIEIFVAQNERATMGAGAFLGDPKSSGVTEMQPAGGRRRKTPAIGPVRKAGGRSHAWRGVLARVFHDQRRRNTVAQTSASAASRVGKPVRVAMDRVPCRLGSRRHSRLGSLRYSVSARFRKSEHAMFGVKTVRRDAGQASRRGPGAGSSGVSEPSRSSARCRASGALRDNP